MEEKFTGLEYSMGIRDSANSSMESISFADWEKTISLLLEDCFEEKSTTLLPQPQTLRDFFVIDKLNYFNQVSSNIQKTKSNFLEHSQTINTEIDEMTQRIVLQVHARRQELKNQLNSIKSKKVNKWDRQLSVCEEALKRLKAFSSLCGNDYFWNENLTKELQYIDAGEIKFQCEEYQSLLENLKSLGFISCHIDASWSDVNFCNFKSLAPKFIFGSSGGLPGQFCRPWGVCSDGTGRILICDRSNHRIQIFDECGRFLLAFGEEGSGPGKFNRPSGIDVDIKCKIVVADKDNHRIQVFTYSGSFLFEFGSQGTRPGQFMYPWDVSVNSNCDIAVSDSKNHRVQLFNERGRFITLFDAEKVGIRDPRSMLRFLDSPRGLAFRPDGSLLVTDFNNHRVLVIDKTFSKITTFGCQGLGAGEFFRPQGIACYKNGTVAVSDSKNYRVQVFGETGRFLRTFGSQGTNSGEFDCPQGISFHRNGNILVVDLNNNRVQVF